MWVLFVIKKLNSENYASNFNVGCFISRSQSTATGQSICSMLTGGKDSRQNKVRESIQNDTFRNMQNYSSTYQCIWSTQPCRTLATDSRLLRKLSLTSTCRALHKRTIKSRTEDEKNVTKKSCQLSHKYLCK